MHNEHIRDVILRSTGASKLSEPELIQELWSGYGTIARYHLTESEIQSVVVKHVDVGERADHPRGWNTNRSHQRKLKSYAVELAWYRSWSSHLDSQCRVPKHYGLHSSETGNSFLMIFEDLDAAGFNRRKPSASRKDAKLCLEWLAHFHSTFLGESPTGLWETGTYWHLKTRPDELEALNDGALKEAAPAIDRRLRECPYQTFVHGDAKLANFCFTRDGKGVAAVDFQYVGGGCGIKDVAYLIGSCFGERDCERYETELLDYYFARLKSLVRERHATIDPNRLVESWRALFPFAWADFHRFIKGWSPGHWKINSYSERMTRGVLEQI